MMETPSYPTAHAMVAVFDHHRNDPRKRLLEFLMTISREDFVRSIPEMGGKSLRDILLHMIGASEFWISLLQNRPHNRFSNDDYKTIESIIPIVEEVSDRIQNVLSGADEDWFAREMTVSAGGQTMRLIPAMAAVHMLTHEYHHKGQIVTIARMLGYEPPDTDLL